MLKPHFRRLESRIGKKVLYPLVVIVAFGVIGGIITVLSSRAATPGIVPTIDTSLPNPTNVKTYADDRLVTVWWDQPSNASSKGIVGYYVTWGTQSSGVYTNAKQTAFTITQIQPVNNGTVYNVKVQSIHGSYTQVPTPNSWGGGTAEEARASGRVSSGVVTTVNPTSTRVDQLRTQMTGFFDDFNTPAGAFDELKWNQATSACVGKGQAGAFINSQYHSHNQAATHEDPYCDRGQMATRPRATFDITGKTEADPGVIVADFDGTSMPARRDIWYIDLIPIDARSNKIPLDITGHADASHSDPADPAMLRILQTNGQVNFSFTNDSKQHTDISANAAGDSPCGHWSGEFTDFWEGGGCNKIQVGNNIPIKGGQNNLRTFPVPNVRMHWRVEISPTKLKVYLNGIKVADGNTPSYFANIKQFTVHSTIFTYNTGKDSGEKQTTTMLHWDNFGFNGPAPTTVVHNYQDGQSNGLSPVLGTGTASGYIGGGGTRTSKINIPDQIASPKQSRLMFTINCIGFGDWSWSSAQHVLVNGKRYDVPNPASLQKGTVMGGAGHYVPYAFGIVLNTSDLKQGMNDIKFGLSTCDALNVHIELEYQNGTQPSYTQPKDVFGAQNFLAAIQPTMSSHDNYLFIEQDMGLQSGVISADPSPTDTQAPTVSITSPTNNSTVLKSTETPILITANDNIGVNKVELYIDNNQVPITITHSPFNHLIDTSSWSNGNHTLHAIAFDAAGNGTRSSTITINVVGVLPNDKNYFEAEDGYLQNGMIITDSLASKGRAIRF